MREQVLILVKKVGREMAEVNKLYDVPTSAPFGSCVMKEITRILCIVSRFPDV